MNNETKDKLVAFRLKESELEKIDTEAKLNFKNKRSKMIHYAINQYFENKKNESVAVN